MENPGLGRDAALEGAPSSALALTALRGSHGGRGIHLEVVMKGPVAAAAHAPLRESLQTYLSSHQKIFLFFRKRKRIVNIVLSRLGALRATVAGA